jgi:hypothetical protein
LRPTSTAVASMPARRPDLAILRVNPDRFLGLLATLAIEALPTRRVWVDEYPPTTNRTSGPFGVLAGIRADSRPGPPDPANLPDRDQQRRR